MMKNLTHYLSLILITFLLLGNANIVFASEQKPAPDGDIFASMDMSKEIPGKRNRNAKHFIQEDGTIKAIVSSGPIHYEKNGIWKDIINDIVPDYSNHKGEYAYSNLTNQFKSYYSSASNSGGVLTMLGQNEVQEFTNVGMYWLVGDEFVKNESIRNVYAKINNSVLVYPSAFNKTDIRFIQTNTGRKLDYILNDPSALADAPANATALVYMESIKIPQGWIVKSENNTLNIYNEKHEWMISYDAPVIYENQTSASETQNSIEGEMAYEVDGNTITYQVIVPLSWLQDPQRNYPVVVDPSANYYPDNSAYWTGYQTSSTGKSSGYLRITGNTTASWAKFNLSGLFGATQKVTLYTYFYNNAGGDKYTYIRDMGTTDPVPSAAADIWTASNTGTLLHSNHHFGATSVNWYSSNLGSGGVTAVDNRMAQGWISLGFTWASGYTTFQYCYGYNGTYPPYLEIEYSVAGFDLALESIESPSIFNVGNNNLEVRVQNNREDTIYYFDLGYQLNNNTPVTVSKYYPPQPMISGGFLNYTFATPLNLPSAGNYNFKVWIANANDSMPDNDPGNDTLDITLCTGLTGTFTIGSSASADYSSFTEAVAAIQNCGIIGPVTFEVEAGTYTERIIIPPINGASAVNTITFDGIDKSTRTLTYYGTSTASRATVVLYGADYVTFKNLTIENTSYSYALSVFFTDGADYNTFDNCNLEVPISGTSNIMNLLASSDESNMSGYGINANYNTVKNSNIKGGYYGVRFNGSATNVPIEGNSFINNDFNNQYYYGLYFYYHRGTTIQLNKIANFAYAYAYGIYSYYGSNTTIDANEINAGRYALYMYYDNYYLTGNSQVTNNIIANFGDASIQTGLRIYYNYYNTVAHNTVWLTGTSSSTSYCALYSYGNYYSDFLNNIFVQTGNSYVLYNYSGYYNTWDYNLFYSNSTNFIYWEGSYYTDLNTLKTLYPTDNQHSWEAYPSHLISSANPRITASAYQVTNVGLDHDVDGQCRAPYGNTELGADEIPVNMTFNSVQITKPDTSAVFAGMRYAKMLRVDFDVSGCANPLSVGSVYFSTSGSTATQDIENVRFFNVEGEPLDINNQIEIISHPNGAFSISAPPGVTIADVPVLITAYDVDADASIGHFLDMTFDSIEVGGIMRYPSTQAVGKREIVHPTNYQYCDLQRINSGNFTIGFTRFIFGDDIDNSSQTLQNPGNAVEVFPSAIAEVSKQANYSFTMYHGSTNDRGVSVYIDLNNDGYFTIEERIKYYSVVPAGNIMTDNYTIPCEMAPGIHRMRIITDFYVNIPAACGTTDYGEAEDYFLKVLPEKTPVASFTKDTASWVGGITVFNPIVDVEGPMDFIWNYGDNSPLDTTETGRHIYTQGGNFIVTLQVVLYGCDSTFVAQPFSDTMKIIMPTVKPDANFISDINVTTTAIPVNFTDLSSMGPYKWKWIVNPPMVNGMPSHHIMPSDTHQHPTMYFDELGNYEITLIATNVIGSDTVIKQKYIQVVQEQIMCVDDRSNMVSGYLYDDGGKDGTYSNPTVGLERTCSFIIEPKCASSITLAFLDFDVVEVGNSACLNLTGDAVRIYDGTDNTGTPLHLQFVNPFSGQPDYPNGFDNRNGVIPPGVTANSGSMFVEFYVNCGSVGQGFEARWNTVSYTPITPVASISAPTQAYTGTPLALNSTSTGDYLDYGWDVDADGSNDFLTENIIHTFTSPGTYTVRLIIYSCHEMTDTAYHTITVVNPPNPPSVDFTVDYNKLTPQDIASFTDLSHESVTSWNWEITPNTFSFVNGTSNSSQNPQVQFDNTGYYTVKLTVENYLGSNSVSKSNYIEVYVYCDPAVAVLNPDVGISVMTLQNIFGDTLIHQMSDIGNQAYTDYSLTQQAALTKGGTYTITLKRNSVFNDISRSLWIDLNKDGMFDDSEELASDVNKGTLLWTSNFTVPLTAMEGLSRLRVGVNLGNQKNKGCGPNYSGEFEDYGITINTDKVAPVITLQGTDTVLVNSCASFADPGYSALDDVNGDLTSAVTVTGGPVITFAADTFYLKYNVGDVAGNPANEATRIVIVLPDIIPPVITLNGKNPDSIRVKTAYIDPRATATDDCSGLATPANFAAINTLNTNYLGTYALYYVAEDNAGNADTVSRTVYIYDDIDPLISLNGNNVMSMEVNTSFNDPGVTFSDNYDNNMQVKIIGSVDTSRIGTYFLNYCVSDSSGNGPVCVDRTIEVYDNTSPVLTLKGYDTVIVEVFGVYNEPGYNYSDNYYSQNDIIVTVTGSVNTYVLGDYILSYKATDGSGNVSSALNRLVRVVDLVKPSIRLNGANMLTVQRWNDFVDPGVTVMDNYDKASDITVFYNENGSWDNDSKLQVGLFTYTYRAEDKSGNSSEEITRLIYVEQNTSINDYALTMNNISFYPNPAKDQLNINIDFPEFNELSINIYNALGEKVLEIFDGMFKDGSMPVDISSLKSGIYFIRFQVAEDQQMNSKLIVR